MKKQPETDLNQPVDDQTEGSDRFPDFYYEYQPDELAAWAAGNNVLSLTCKNGCKLQIEAVTDQILRFRYAPRGAFERDFSYALDPEPALTTPSAFTIAESEDHLVLLTEELECRVDKKDLRTVISERSSGFVLSRDATPFYARYSILNGLEEVRLQKRAATDECYFGLGDKSCDLNLRGKKLENWNTDSYSFGKQTDPLYRAIPFYYGLTNDRAYGIFLHNTHRSSFDFDKSGDGLTTLSGAGGEMDYFFLYGPALLEVARLYHALTGRPEMPPRWALGFHQCRWSYYPDSRVREVAREFRQRRIPCDAIYLDIDYMDGYRCFTWNKDFFPDPKALIDELREEGFQTIVMIDPGIRVDENYEVYQDGLKYNAFCRRSTGELMRGPVWPPECVFPDYTRPEVRQWWGALYQGLYEEDGVSGFWNDMNEPAIFQVASKTFPDNVRHDCDGEPADHRRVHNVYGQQMSRASYEGLKKLKPFKRPFVLTRATFSGGQRYASVWTGDNIASWEHLRLANLQSQRLSISGFSLVGSDIGGFANQPSGDLFVRWLQLGVFHPLFRVHSMGNNKDGGAEVDVAAVLRGEEENRMDQEPWSFGEENTRLVRLAIALRYQLLPYLYTAFRQQTADGTPVIKSLVFEDQTDPQTYRQEREFLFGDHLLVSPVMRADAAFQNVYFPRGIWYDYWTGRSFAGRATHRIPLQEDRIPVFVRAGAVIPNFPVMQYCGERPVEQLELRVYPGEAASHLYEDAGEGYDYQRGDYAWFSYHTHSAEGTLRITQERRGQYQPAWRSCRLLLIGLPGQPREVLVDGKPVAGVTAQNGEWQVVVPADFSDVSVRT